MGKGDEDHHTQHQVRDRHGLAAVFRALLGGDRRDAVHHQRQCDHPSAPDVDGLARQYRPGNRGNLGHPDRDHLNDLPNFMSVFPESPGVILQNKTIPTAIRYDPPEADYSQCLMSLDDRLRYSVADDRDPSQPSINGGVEYTSSFNSYVSGMTTNNASVVTMISFRGLVIVCPGDIEDSGWRRFWSNSGHLFEQKLRNASCVILVAPHHGGHSCYSKQLLENVRPNVCLISDLLGRTETHEAYRLFPMGYRFFNGPSSEYYSTKSTGSRIKIWVDEPGFFYLDQYKERT